MFILTHTRDRHGDDNQDIPPSNTESFSLQDNPVYVGTTVQPHPPASYSSLGHAYELVEANEGAGHMYDVVNRNQQRGRSVNQGGQNTSTDSTAVNPVNIDPNPQDYKIPTPTMKPRGADEDDEEYSRLQH